MQKNVQIPYELFMDLIRFHLFEIYGNEKKIQRGLEQKLSTMAEREFYTQYKTAETKAGREEARQHYLDSKGIRESFRW